MGKRAKEEISANTKLKAELTETLEKPPWVLPPRCDCTGEEQTKPELRGGSWGTVPEAVPGRGWQHSPPREGYTLKWEFACPTCLSCKTTAALENCTQLIISSSGIFCISSAKWISFNCAQAGTMLPFSRAHGGQRNSAGRAPSDNSLSHQGRIFQGCLSSLDSRPSLQHRAGQHSQGRRVSGAGICHWPRRPCKALLNWPSLDHFLVPS